MALGSGSVIGILLGVWITRVRSNGGIILERDLALVIDGYQPVIAVGKLMGIILAVAAAIVVGGVGGVAVRSHLVLAAVAGSVVAAASSLATIVLTQWCRGRWPVGAVDGWMIAVAMPEPSTLLILHMATPAMLSRRRVPVSWARAFVSRSRNRPL